jgi:hypothetical protein
LLDAPERTVLEAGMDLDERGAREGDSVKERALVVAEAPELLIATRVSAAAQFMATAVDFHDQPNARRDEVSDVAPAEHDLAPETKRSIDSRGRKRAPRTIR